MTGWKESLAYTEDDLALTLRFGWVKRRWFGRGFKVTARITPLVDLENAGRLSPSEKHESQIAIAVCACRLNEEQYQEGRRALTELGVDPETLP